MLPFDFEKDKVNPYYYTLPLEQNPLRYNFDELYYAKTKAYKLEADFYLLSNLGTKAFTQLLDQLKVSYKSVPLDIKLYCNKKPEKQYFLIFIIDVISMLDKKHSELQLFLDKYTNEPIMENGFTKYDEISKFIIDNDKIGERHLFYCADTNKLVCSSIFKKYYTEYNLIGIDFKIIDDDYKYEPMKDLIKYL